MPMIHISLSHTPDQWSFPVKVKFHSEVPKPFILHVPAENNSVEACTKTHMAREDQGTIRLSERLSNSIGRPGPSSTPSIGHITSTYAVVRSDLIQLKNGEDIGATYASFVSISCVNMLHLQAIPIHLLLAHLNVLWLEGADHWQYNRFHKSGRWTRLCLDSFILCTRANGRPRRAMGCARETVSGLSEKILGISYTCLYLVEMNRWDAVDVRQPAVSGIKDCGRFIWGVLSVA